MTSKKRKLNPKIIRVGDWVEIINPVFVTRWGYPLSFQDAVKHIEETYNEEINKFSAEMLDKILGRIPRKDDLKFIETYEHQTTSKGLNKRLVKAIAFEYLGSKKFGGSERTLSTKIVEACKGDIALVFDIKIVKTGTYYGPSGGYDSYSGEYDYDPGGLSNAKTHKLLELTFCANYPPEMKEYKAHYLSRCNEPCIEVCNVKKVEKL